MEAKKMLALAAALLAGPALAMQPLADSDLSAVRGRDGVSFDLNGYAMSGDVRVTYTAPNGSSIYKGNLAASRTDSSDAFADPYRIDIVQGQNGLADVMQLSFPTNAAGEQRWQFAYDWGMQSNGITRDNGAVVINDMVFRGGGLQFSTPQNVDGIAWGAALRVDIGQLAYRPVGRNDMSGQMALSNIQLGAVDSNGNFTGDAWQLAHVASQPGILNALNDDSGPRLHIGIDWPDARNGTGAAPAGGLAIGNISFNNPSGGSVDLGSSRIGSIQIQYLDVRFRR
ncbi:hypothetical protein GCM10027277_55900 [Pseudoduganella ginsengisoli]|uniref:DUF6160 domain-containing protein n=1 Tax=Pseudoduganella ginsengisoli TaxID=1462440 RepID=A0A6L6Q692_9BURK|nr:DUF6160 family protein [Pseudoduganella ginsengisoli]MTW05026.1 hypothetical protein [Pseudoduganella ginsengisoli]